MQIMKIIEFHTRIQNKQKKKPEVPCENHENPRFQYENQENHWSPKIPMKNYENHEHPTIPRENNENNKNHRIP